MDYTRIVNYVSSAVWAILPEKLSEILSVLAFRAGGHTFTAEEIRARLGDRPAAGAASGARAGQGTALVPIRGTVAHRMGQFDDSSGGTSCERLSGQLRALVADPSIGTIVFDCDTPGGTVSGVSELAAEIFAARGSKRLVAIANASCCSAGYWLASQAHEIVAIPSATVGSLGVFAAHASLEEALKKEGVAMTLVSFGRFKTEGNPFQKLTAEAQAQLQRKVDQAGLQFVSDVARGRGLSSAEVRTRYGDGRTLTAVDALAAGLIDRIGTLPDTIVRAQRAAAAPALMQAHRRDLVRAALEPARQRLLRAELAEHRRALAAATKSVTG